MINFFTDQHTNWSLLSLTYYYIHTEKYIYRQLMALDGVVTNWIKGVFLNFFSTEIGKTAHKMALELTKEISRNAETWTVGKTGKTGFLEKKITTACRTRNSKLGKWVFLGKSPRRLGKRLEPDAIETTVMTTIIHMNKPNKHTISMDPMTVGERQRYFIVYPHTRFLLPELKISVQVNVR